MQPVRSLVVLLGVAALAAGCSTAGGPASSEQPEAEASEAAPSVEPDTKPLPVVPPSESAAAAKPAPVEIPPFTVAPAGVLPKNEYRIGPEDDLEVSVFGNETLATRQRVRPDGTFSFPIVGEIDVRGMTPGQLRARITKGLAPYISNPQVSVVVAGFGSHYVNVLGEVRRPGVVVLDSDPTLMHTIALTGGITNKADLHGAVVIRDGVVLPVSIEKLVRNHDFDQNLVLEPNDTIMVPDLTSRRALVIGEVKVPSIVTLRDNVTVLEALTRAQGFTREASRSDVVLVRTGPSTPEVKRIDAAQMLGTGNLALNVTLESGDIIYVPRSTWKSVVEVFQDIMTILSPAIMAETGVILGPNFVKVFQGQGGQASTGIVVTP